MKQLQADAIIVAAGPAGLAAAITLCEKGVKPIIFEKSVTSGGCAKMGMGPLGINTHVQRAQFNDISVPYALSKHMEYTHYRVDADLVSAYFNLSADTIKWLEDMGVKFAGAFRYSRDSEATWHIVQPEEGDPGPRCASAMTKIMTRRAEELGTEIFYKTAVYDLIVENGTVCGVLAKTKDGEEIAARAGAVLVCTGGFSGNPGMVKSELGIEVGKDILNMPIGTHTGDGLQMMWRAGAQKYGLGLEVIYLCEKQMAYMALDGMFRQSNLIVNRDGKRIMNEGDMCNTTFMGNAILNQPGKFVYSIMDGRIADTYKKNGLTNISLVENAEVVDLFDDAIEDALEDGYAGFIIADTLEEFAEKLGVPEQQLKQTLDTYNSYCACGVDRQFGKDASYLKPITGEGKYMALKYYASIYGTLGGVRINRKCEVQDNDGQPIPGLYSAGTDANTIYGDSYNFKLPGNSMGFALNTGRMAGAAMSEYLSDHS